GGCRAGVGWGAGWRSEPMSGGLSAGCAGATDAPFLVPAERGRRRGPTWSGPDTKAGAAELRPSFALEVSRPGPGHGPADSVMEPTRALGGAAAAGSRSRRAPGPLAPPPRR